MGINIQNNYKLSTAFITQNSLPFVENPAIIGRTPSLGPSHHDMEQATRTGKYVCL